MKLIILFIGISSYFVSSETNKEKGLKDDLEYWKPDYIKEKTTGNISNTNIRRHDTKSKRSKDGKISKWPKVSKSYNRKGAARMTKMQMMKQEETTKTNDDYLDDGDPVLNEFLNPYSIKEQLIHIIRKFPNINLTVDVIGRTVEYNDIILLKIAEEKTRSDKYFRADAGKYADDLPEKKIIFIVHGLSVLGINALPCLTYGGYFVKLVSYYLSHLDKFDIYLLPMANPDGIAKIRMTSLWNKNYSPQNDCPGVALDRNFDIAWNKNHSINSCHQDYPGSAPFSEIETRAVREVFHKYSHKIVAYLNVHAASNSHSTFKGDAVLYPKGYTDSVSDDDKYIDLKGEIDEAIRNASFQVISVTVDTLHSWYGRVTGSSVDYASTIYGIPFALELLMQAYSTDGYQGNEPPNFAESALVDLWRRVIDVILNYISRTLHENDV